MSSTEITTKIQELRELRRMAEELGTEITSIEDTIKAEMTTRNVNELSGTDWKVTWKTVNSSRFDSRALKAANPTLYEAFNHTTESRRFCLA